MWPTSTEISHIFDYRTPVPVSLISTSPELADRPGAPQLYLPCSNSGRIYEVVKVNGAKRRTWFVGDDSIDGKLRARRCRGSN
jgi:hypothetical protein